MLLQHQQYWLSFCSFECALLGCFKSKDCPLHRFEWNEHGNAAHGVDVAVCPLHTS
jgi:hypothetical protein